jgi:hypothetical protein
MLDFRTPSELGAIGRDEIKNLLQPKTQKKSPANSRRGFYRLHCGPKQILHCPQFVYDASRHRGREPQATAFAFLTSSPAEIEVGPMDGDGSRQVLEFLAENAPELCSGAFVFGRVAVWKGNRLIIECPGRDCYSSSPNVGSSPAPTGSLLHGFLDFCLGH